MLVILLASTFNTYNKCISLQYEKSYLHNTRDGFSGVIVQEHSSWTTALKQISIVQWTSVRRQSWLCWTHLERYEAEPCTLNTFFWTFDQIVLNNVHGNIHVKMLTNDSMQDNCKLGIWLAANGKLGKQTD